MKREEETVRVIERLANLLIVRIFIYVMAGLWTFRLLYTLLWPSGVGTDYWIRVGRETARDLAVIVGFFFVQSYAANYTNRRASFQFRRRDIATICLLLLIFAALDTSLRHGFLFVIPFCALIYIWELYNIHQDEKKLSTPKA